MTSSITILKVFDHFLSFFDLVISAILGDVKFFCMSSLINAFLQQNSIAFLCTVGRNQMNNF